MLRRTTFGRPALEELRRAVAAAKATDPMAPVTVLVPTNVAALSARRFLAAGLRDDANGVAGIWFTTLPRLAEQLAATRLHANGRRPTTEPVLATAIRRELDAAPGQFEAVAEHPATAQAIARAHRDLRDVDDDALDAITGCSTLTADVVRVHRALNAALAPDWYDAADLLRTATERITADPDCVTELGAVVAFLLPALSRREQHLLDALESAVPVTPIVAGEKIAPDEAGAQRVLTASDSDDEVRCVVREVVGALRDTPAHRVGILYSDRTPYARLLHEHLAQAGIAVNGAGVRPVIERALPRFLLSLLDTARTGWGRGALLRTLGEVPVRDGGGKRIPITWWERLSREAGVVGDEDWSERLTTLAHRRRGEAATKRDEYPAVAGRLERDAEAAEALAAFVAALRGRVDGVATARTWRSAGEHLNGLLDGLLPEPDRVKMPLEEQYANGVVGRAVVALAALDDGPDHPSLPGLQDALQLSLHGGLPRVGQFGTGVYVGPVADAVGLDLDAVYVVGLSEDLYPGRLHEDSLLPQRVRQQSLDQLSGLRADVDRRERELVAALQSAPSVTVSFPRGDLRRHTNRLPSRWLLPTLRTLAGDPGMPATSYEKATGAWLAVSPSYAGSIERTPLPASEQEWRQRAALVEAAGSGGGMLRDDPAVAADIAMRSGRTGQEFTPYDGNLAGLEGRWVIHDGTRLLSPTSLEGYAACPHAWFVQRMLGVSPIEEPQDSVEIQPAEVGSLVHDAFDAWITEAADANELPDYGQPWTAAQRARLQQIGATIAAAYEQSGRTGHPKVWERRRADILRTLDWMVGADNDFRAATDARVVCSELAFGSNGADPMVIEIDGGVVAFRGSIDKVDETRDGTLLVTDIKTGSARTFKALSEDNPVENGTKLQLPVYAYAARQALGRPDAPVEASYWFVLKDRGKRVAVPLTDQVERIYRTTVGGLVAGIESGWFPHRAPETADWRWVQCAYCNPDGLGHVGPRRRWEELRIHAELEPLVAILEPDVIAAKDADRTEEDA